MPRIRTSELLELLAEGNFNFLKLKGLQNGSFYLMVENSAGAFIHENLDGSIKEYPRVDDALSWLKRKTSVNSVVVDIEIWNADSCSR
ncbi:MAG TPA: hypothetical protein VLE19_07230 [Pyrinomonadaceae bacterium]|nr:hypothetical protein [Pyrinomonadaceae bacterium]